MADPDLRRAFLEFEIALDSAAADEVREEGWGRAFLSPSLPLVWDASYIAVEPVGLGMADIEVLGDGVLGGAGFGHRTVVVVDEAEGRRLAEEAETVAGWEAERTRYMIWRGASQSVRPKVPQVGQRTNGPTGFEVPVAGFGTREVAGAAIASLRRRLTAESMSEGASDRDATAEQLLDLDRRLDEVGGDRWFVAPDDGPGASVCRLLRDGSGVGQVEDVATLESARGRGLATAVIRAALAASLQGGDTTNFIAADAADWPQFLYEKLGFVAVGDLHVLRRRPNP